MTSTEKKWKYENDEEEKLAKYLISLEEEALKKYFKGDMSGYKELWSKTNFSYFDVIPIKESMNINKYVIDKIKI